MTAGEMRTSPPTSSPISSFAAAAGGGSTLTSVMPQIGHSPGSSRTMSGCIGHRYLGLVCFSACSASVSSAAVRSGSLGCCFEQPTSDECEQQDAGKAAQGKVHRASPAK